MSFEEEFPSLCKKEGDKYKYLLVEGGLDDSCYPAKDLVEVDYVEIDAVKEHCLDKQKVRDAIAHLKEKMADDWILIEEDVIRFEKELGL
jgi:hypothetical protein